MKVGISTATFFSKVLTEDSFSSFNVAGESARRCSSPRAANTSPPSAICSPKGRGIWRYIPYTRSTRSSSPSSSTRSPAPVGTPRSFTAKSWTSHAGWARVFYTFHGRMRLKRNMVISPEAAGRRMRELGDIAMEYGVRLCFENVHWAMFNTPEFFAAAKEFCPEVGRRPRPSNRRGRAAETGGNTSKSWATGS